MTTIDDKITTPDTPFEDKVFSALRGAEEESYKSDKPFTAAVAYEAILSALISSSKPTPSPVAQCPDCGADMIEVCSGLEKHTPLPAQDEEHQAQCAKIVTQIRAALREGETAVTEFGKAMVIYNKISPYLRPTPPQVDVTAIDKWIDQHLYMKEHAKDAFVMNHADVYELKKLCLNRALTEGGEK